MSRVRIGTVNSNGLKVHIEPPYGRVVDELAKGDKVAILSDRWTETTKWHLVRTARGQEGYAAARFIDIVRVIPDVPAPEPAPEYIPEIPKIEPRFEWPQPHKVVMLVAGIVAAFVFLRWLFS